MPLPMRKMTEIYSLVSWSGRAGGVGSGVDDILEVGERFHRWVT